MLTRKDRKIRNQEAMIKNRDILIGDMQAENKALYEENKDLGFENEEQKDFINIFVKELYSNIKTDEQIVAKLKELVHDYQSRN